MCAACGVADDPGGRHARPWLRGRRSDCVARRATPRVSVQLQHLSVALESDHLPPWRYTPRPGHLPKTAAGPAPRAITSMGTGSTRRAPDEKAEIRRGRCRDV